MKLTSKNVSHALDDITLIESFTALKDNQPNYEYQETSLNEAFEDFIRISGLISSTIDNNLFDKVSYNKRHQIWKTISSLQQHLTQAKNYSFNTSNQNVKNSANAVIQQVVTLIDLVETTNLYARSIGLESYKDEVKKLADIRKKYRNILDEVSQINEVKNEIQESFDAIQLSKKSITEIESDTKNKLSEIEEVESIAKKNNDAIIESREKVKEYEQEIESKKLSINSFSDNIDEYKTAIDKLKQNADYVLNKKAEIDVIISNAEKALKLNSAIGISAAFSSQYDRADQQAKLKIGKQTYSLWIVGALVFIFAAIGITIWIAAGSFENSNGSWISLLAARIVAVAITITGATFCTKQYIKQQNIAEDYAYKAVLSKSIVAFTDEIKKKDEQQVAEYLTKVLDEIHKDPLRERTNKDETSQLSNLNEIVKELIKNTARP